MKIFRNWIKRVFNFYDIEDLAIGGHCGLCGKWVDDKICEKGWRVVLCKECCEPEEKKFMDLLDEGYKRGLWSNKGAVGRFDSQNEKKFGVNESLKTGKPNISVPGQKGKVR